MVIASGGWYWDEMGRSLRTRDREISFSYTMEDKYLEKVLLYLHHTTLESLYEPAIYESPTRPPKGSQIEEQMFEQIVPRPKTTIKMVHQGANKYVISRDPAEHDGAILVLWGVPGNGFEILPRTQKTQDASLICSTHQDYNGLPRVDFCVIIWKNSIFCLKIQKPDGTDQYYLLMNSGKFSILEFSSQEKLGKYLTTARTRGENFGSGWPNKRGHFFDSSLAGGVLTQKINNPALF